MHLSYMKTKTRKNKKTRKTGGNKDFILRTSCRVWRGPPQGGTYTCEIHTNANGDVKIGVYTNKEYSPSDRNYNYNYEILKSVGNLPDEWLPLYKLVLEDGRLANHNDYDMIQLIKKITKLIISNQKPLETCHNMLETCESEKKSLENENKTLINRTG